MYKKRKHSKSGFEKYCKSSLKAIKSASKAGTRSKAAKRYQACLNSHGIRTGLKDKKSKN